VDDIDRDSEREITRMITEDCLKAISEGDAESGLVMAHLFIGEIPSKDIFIHTAVIEALVMLSAQLGCADAKNFLDNRWPKLKPIFIRRFERRGLK